MSFKAADINENLLSTNRAAANLSSSCQGILDTYIAPSSSDWYGTLQAELEQAQNLAQEWRSQYFTKFRTDILDHVASCGQEFAVRQPEINRLFDQMLDDQIDAKFELQRELATLASSVQMILSAVVDYELNLRDWGQELEQVHRRMTSTVSQVQEQEASLKSQIDSINTSIASLQSQILVDRDAIIKAKQKEAEATEETIFSIMLAPITGGVSLILAGIGVSSIAEAEGKVAAIERTINDYQSRIVSAQENLTQDQAQLVTLNGSTLSASIALNDINVAEQLLDGVRISWAAFSQELDDVVVKVTAAQNSAVMIVEKAWFNAACKEWNLIATGVQELVEASA